MTATGSGLRPATAGLHLLFVIDSLGSGGAQRQLVLLALGLAARGHRPVVCVYHPQHDYFGDELTRAGIDVHVLDKPSRFSVAPVVGLRRLMRSGRFDVVMAFLPTPSVYAELASLAAGTRVPLIVSERSAYIDDRPTRAERARAQFHRVANRVVANSHHHRRILEANYPWMRRRLRTIWNGVDLSRFAPASIDETRSADLVAVGSIRPYKNARGLARALVALKEGGHEVPRVLWAGKREPVPESAREEAEVDAVLDAAGLADRWTWLGERRDVVELLRTHAALVHPSFIEGLSNSVCEALATGTPVLAGAVGDQPRLVDHGRSGFLFEPGSPASIAAAILAFQQLSAPLRQQMGLHARQFAEASLAMPVACDAYERLFFEVARSGTGANNGGHPAGRVGGGTRARHLSSHDESQ